MVLAKTSPMTKASWINAVFAAAVAFGGALAILRGGLRRLPGMQRKR